ncbi:MULTISPECIES: ABC transporter substrate-binding protein [Haloferax]|uniref:ABC-type dipeptide/oligopeptide/nickel transport system, substrate binding protein n=1 Tax=Haloferax mediterranei (strain ATCC 33500 / DSM 1411 / JCM 8866 / NBRC 14739 / NCIMB 2177 / R-4) TaxID=523841 RepID=I3RA38_HALMT|nr:ABC transporter substrate-binding protein [Haloferax mediterranei]AFK21098.1 ABC-type dipeptide/oligopeptide/nickel transport system, substrate binding protein [Haloferax mediterranei ATCC 33500]AHZ24314.1 peptide ABC transporter substrate-binding protein [Haloferax mediterranei ATCC 33500]EMA05400.1 ABC-type dipeptide/oligopeptide/nickel transport system, substrate binding protein [Haloferax mediterranei ATCC 33500]MDX5989802.1 ABC transporter substrate-binding protein [Haloferax mediterran
MAVTRDPTREKWDVYNGVTPYFTHVFEPLVGVTDDMQTEPLLATDWEAVDETTWDFSLREDVTFHNGEPLTAAAVVHSFESVFEQWSWVPGWIGVEPNGVTAVDKHTVRFQTTEPFPAFPGTISHNYFGIQHPDATDTPVGTGPFQVSHVEKEQSVTLTPYEGYRNDAERPSKLTFKWIKDPNTRLLSLEKGSIDIAQTIPKSRASSVSDASETAIETGLSPSAGLVAVNLYKSPTDDELLRKALNWAVDQKQLVESALNGIGKPARGPISSVIPWAVHDDLPTYGPDREKARELVEKSKYDGETLSILVNSENTDDGTIAQILNGWFSDINVKSEIRQVDPASFNDTFTAGEANLTLVGFGSNSAACDYLIRAMFHSEGSDNRKLHERNGTGVYNPGPEIDRLIEDGYRAETMAKKREYYGEVQKRVVDTGAVIPLYYNEHVLGRQSSVSGIDGHPIDKMVGWSSLSREQ